MNLPAFTPSRPVAQRQPRERNRAYLDSFAGRACEACGLQDDTVVGAHVRFGVEGGMGYKPPDYLVVALCVKCHRDREANPGADWWMRVLKRMLKLRYQEWVMVR